MEELGEVLKAEAKIDEAHQQFQSAYEIDQKLGAKGLAADTQTELADLALEEGRPDQAESLIRPAIVQMEQEKNDPSAAGAYTVLSRALLMQRKTAEADKAIRRAAALTHTSPDPNLKLPVTIQTARVEIAEAGSNAAGLQTLQMARRKLLFAAPTAKKLGYYVLECEARLALGELELKRNPAQGRAQLRALTSEARHHGLELLARKAELAADSSPALLAAKNPAD